MREQPLANAVEVSLVLVLVLARAPPRRRCLQRHPHTVLKNETHPHRAELLVAKHRLHVPPGNAPPPEATNVCSLPRQIDAESADPQRLGNEYAAYDDGAVDPGVAIVLSKAPYANKNPPHPDIQIQSRRAARILTLASAAPCSRVMAA